ncbi:MAG: hypothetical protein WD069_08425 [Planctomycetales bacterium]
MTQDELLNRLHRIYSAVGATTVFDMAKLPGKVFRGEKIVGVFQDFSGGLTEHDITNAAQSVIHNIASLHDHLKKWARANGKDASKVDIACSNSLHLQIVRDLWDQDKHGGDRRDGGFSQRSPRLGEIRSQMTLTTQPKAGSWVTMTLGPKGEPVIHGDGSAKAIITAEVVDKDGQALGDLFEIGERCVQVWESLLVEFGLALPETGT